MKSIKVKKLSAIQFQQIMGYLLAIAETYGNMSEHTASWLRVQYELELGHVGHALAEYRRSVIPDVEDNKEKLAN